MPKNKEKQTTKVEVTETVEVETKKEVQHYSRCSECHHCNNQSHVGVPSTAQKIKLKWHQAHFDDSEFRTLPDGRHQHYWKPKHSSYPSLKQFARQLVAQGDQLGKDWFDHKSGSLNEERSANNIKIATEARMASRTARRKKSGSGGKSTATTTTTTAK